MLGSSYLFRHLILPYEYRVIQDILTATVAILKSMESCLGPSSWTYHKSLETRMTSILAPLAEILAELGAAGAALQTLVESTTAEAFAAALPEVVKALQGPSVSKLSAEAQAQVLAAVKAIVAALYPAGSAEVAQMIQVAGLVEQILALSPAAAPVVPPVAPVAPAA